MSKKLIKEEELPEYVKIRPLDSEMEWFVLTLGKTLLSPYKFSTEREAKTYASNLHICEMIALFSEMEDIKKEMSENENKIINEINE